jgi:DNA replication protein DnaC
LINQTIEALHTLRLDAMAEALKRQSEGAEYAQLSFEERLSMLIDTEVAARENRRLARYFKQAHLRTDAMIEDVDFTHRRGLERGELLSLAECAWVRSHHNVAIVGATGLGKTYLACALAGAAIRRGHSALYLRAPRMLDELAIARADGRFARLISSWARVEVLLIDDYLLRPLSVEQAADTLELIEERAGRRATVFTSQLPVSAWHEAMGDPTLADALADRILTQLHRIELSGRSMRRRDTAQGEVADAGEPPATGRRQRRRSTTS